MFEKISLIDTEALSGVAVKFLDMIEKGIGWVVSPKGGKKDLLDAWEYYKKSIMEDESIPPLVRASKIATARNDLIHYINQGRLIEKTLPRLEAAADLEHVDLDWLSYFFSYARNIQDDTIQTIWANLLAEECNGNTSVQRNLIHVLSLLDTSTAKAFMQLCRLVIRIPIEKINYTFESRYIPQYIPLVASFRWYSIFFILPDDSIEKQVIKKYEECLPSPEQLGIMSELGLINILENAKAEFSYPYNFGLTHHTFKKADPNSQEEILTNTSRKDYIVQYFNDAYKITPKYETSDKDPEKINLGLVQLSSIGEMLFKAIEVEKIDGFEVFLHRFFDTRGFLLEKS